LNQIANALARSLRQYRARVGNGVNAYTLAGKGYFPSAAYTDVIAGFALPLVHIAGAGEDSDDGFTGYVAEGGDGVARWGDYSAAVADGDRIWFASEYIPNKCPVNALPCRTSLTNWARSSLRYDRSACNDNYTPPF
jgi:hypothetical protein